MVDVIIALGIIVAVLAVSTLVLCIVLHRFVSEHDQLVAEMEQWRKMALEEDAASN